MLVSQKRPRDLAWFHAGPLLFGDWGTSRLYVLGLAFAFTGFASPYYLIGLSVLMIGVAWAYTVICGQFHDGGGVYTAARQISPLLGVIGATLLMADYIVTAALSTLDGFHYFGVPEGPGGWIIFACCAGTMFLIGVINWFGPRWAGRFALVIAVITMGLSAIVALACLPYIPAGVKAVDWGTGVPPWTRWTHFASIILALSGVEAVANMTGIMKEPVDRTSAKTIWPILGEVATLNVVFGFALVGIVSMSRSGGLAGFGFTNEEVKNAAMKVIALQAGYDWLGPAIGAVVGKGAAFAFGLLLISAANTVVVDMIGVLYSLGRDRELPSKLTNLNYSGVPWLPLIAACAMPVGVLLFVRDLEKLSDLYAIGVCGAITVNLLCCAYNPRLTIGPRTRAGLWVIGGIVGSIWVTIAITKLAALAFASGLVAVVLVARVVAHRVQARAEATRPAAPALGWLAELRQAPLKLDGDTRRIMLAARGRHQADFAVDLARRTNSTLFVIYVRTLRVLEMGNLGVPRVEEDHEAQESLGYAAMLARRFGVACVPIYACSNNIAEEILDYTVTYGCDTLILGESKRRLFARKLEGDVVADIARHLPPGVQLIRRASEPFAAAPADEGRPNAAGNHQHAGDGHAGPNSADGAPPPPRTPSTPADPSAPPAPPAPTGAGKSPS